MSNFPMYRYGTKEKVTSRDLTDRIAQLLSDCYSDMYGCKVTFKFGGDENETQTATSDTESR